MLNQGNTQLGLRPLTARSVVLSVLLGTHPPRLPARHLVRAGELFEISEGTTRVALSRMLADGEIAREDGAYRLSGRLLERQARQDESRAPSVRDWTGEWELLAVTADSRPPAERAAFRAEMAALRLAELREGVWLRPDNLVRPIPETVASRCRLLRARPEGDSVSLAGTLWDLDAWATQSRRLLQAIDRTSSLAEAFMVSAGVVRHLLSDPRLPPELLPPDWPGGSLREAHQRFDSKWRAILDEHLRA